MSAEPVYGPLTPEQQAELDDRRPHPGGRPTLLRQPSGIIVEGTNLTYHQAIVTKIEATGLTATRCAEAVGLSRRTVEDWINDGRRHHEAASKGAILTNHEYRLAQFSVDCKAAHARWVAAQAEILRQIGNGGLVTSEITETVDPTKQGPDGRPVVLERKVKSSRTLPDARVVQWNLERLAKDEFSPRLEVTGAEGGPVRHESTAAEAVALAAAADAYVQGVEEGKARAAEQEAQEANDG